MSIDNLKKYVPFFLRVGLGLIFLWIGLQEIFHPRNWMRYIPAWLHTTTGIDVFLYILGLINFIIGILILIGMFTRISTFIACLQLFGVIVTVGYGAIAVRDFGLLMMAISLLILGPGKFSVDYYIERSNGRGSGRPMLTSSGSY